jgi:hypothetical protein
MAQMGADGVWEAILRWPAKTTPPAVDAAEVRRHRGVLGEVAVLAERVKWPTFHSAAG